MTHQRKAIRFKAASLAEDGTFEGYGSIFGVVDSYGDIVMPGAFAASLARHAANGSQAKLLWQHDPCHPIGSWLELREDATGLYGRGKILSAVTKGAEALALMRATPPAIDGLSIGYDVVESSMAAADQIEAKYGSGPPSSNRGDQVRLLHALDLWEVSLVTFPACEPARVESVKAAAGLSPTDLDRLAAALARRQRMIRTVLAV